eukprot:114382-Amorphochlora_amoeboformis.AAC.1
MAACSGNTSSYVAVFEPPATPPPTPTLPSGPGGIYSSVSAVDSPPSNVWAVRGGFKHRGGGKWSWISGWVFDVCIHEMRPLCWWDIQQDRLSGW